MNAWIFQANPNRFDVDSYLATNDEIVWLAKQHAKEMQIGDRVFIWRADGDAKGTGGVVASGILTDLPSVMPVPENQKPHWRRVEDLDAASRVWIRLHQVRTESSQVVKRAWIESDPILAGMRITKFRSETNYIISEDQACRLDDLLSRTGEDWTPEEVLAALYVYVGTFGQPISKLPGSATSRLALLIGRCVPGCYNKLMNLRALDPRDERKGMSSVSHVDRDVWSRYFDGVLDEDRVRHDFAAVWGGFDAPVDSEATPNDDGSSDPPRIKVLRSIAVRRGQRKFREKLLRVYGGRCAVTGSSVESLLEAAHIVPYADSGMNSVDNGLLLRADIHTLFDLGLLQIEPSTMTVYVSEEITESPYSAFTGQKIGCMIDGSFPNRDYLETRFRLRS